VNLLRRPIESFLPDGDYRPVAMPTTDVQVLQVLTRQRSVLRRYSDLSSVLVVPGGVGAPAVSCHQPVVDASGAARRSVKLGIGLSLISAIVRALGADGDVEFSYSDATAVEFSYADVVSDRVDLASLDTWLDEADFKPGLRHITDLLVSENVYIVVATLKARALSVTFWNEGAAGFDVAVPDIHATVQGNVSVTAGGAGRSQLTFRGKTALTVAAKAAQLRVDENGFWVSERLAQGGEIREIGGRSYLDDPVLRLAGEDPVSLPH
jgi:hypothetical protein